MYINPYNNPALSQKWRFLKRFVIGFMGYCGFLIKNIKILNLLIKTTITHKPDYQSSQKSSFLRRTWVIVRVNVTCTLTREISLSRWQRFVQKHCAAESGRPSLVNTNLKYFGNSRLAFCAAPSMLTRTLHEWICFLLLSCVWHGLTSVFLITSIEGGRA